MNPASFAWFLGMFGYAAMGVATWLVAPAFGAHRRGDVIRRAAPSRESGGRVFRIWTLPAVILSGALPWIAIRLAWRVPLRRAAAEALFVGYFGALCFIVFLMGIPVGPAKDISASWASINLVPGRTMVGVVRDFPERTVWQLFGNVLLFAPLGFFLPWLGARCRRLAATMSIGLAVSVGIELVQLAMLVAGVSRRAVDIDDVILNVTGAWLGYLAWQARERA